MESYSFPEGHPCYQAKNGGDPDLCQQWRMAEAAEELTGLTLGQVIVTVFEVCLLVSVLIYTARATRQAARSADATIETNRQTRETMIIENRPWLLLKSIKPATDLEWQADEGSLGFDYIFENAGKTAARYVNVWAHMLIIEQGGNPGEVSRFLAMNSPWAHITGDTIAQGREYDKRLHLTFTKEGANNPERDGDTLLLIVRIEYGTFFDSNVRTTTLIRSFLKGNGDAKNLVTMRDGFVPKDDIVLEPWSFGDRGDGHIT